MKILLIALPLALGGCVTTDRDVTAYLDNYYSRADVDAINAEMACKAAAHNLVQIARCEVRR
jgi:DNA-binding phage protein